MEHRHIRDVPSFVGSAKSPVYGYMPSRSGAIFWWVILSVCAWMLPNTVTLVLFPQVLFALPRLYTISCCIALLILAMSISFVFIRNRYRYSGEVRVPEILRFAKDGILAEAKIIDLSIEEGEAGNEYIIRYKHRIYNDDMTRELDLQEYIDRQLYDHLLSCDMVKVRYSRYDPTICIIEDTLQQFLATNKMSLQNAV